MKNFESFMDDFESLTYIVKSMFNEIPRNKKCNVLKSKLAVLDFH